MAFNFGFCKNECIYIHVYHPLCACARTQACLLSKEPIYSTPYTSFLFHRGVSCCSRAVLPLVQSGSTGGGTTGPVPGPVPPDENTYKGWGRPGEEFSSSLSPTQTLSPLVPHWRRPPSPCLDLPVLPVNLKSTPRNPFSFVLSSKMTGIFLDSSSLGLNFFNP